MYKYGDIVLVSFPFTDLKDKKLRPCIVWDTLSSDILLIPITSNISNKHTHITMSPHSQN
ncbi:MAG: type II toxin-antitoxin system PemK/MazF family toxin [Candidatus Peribacteria bacterium]|nr:MAG: type II toxin-antitoxin system PemK/MazF family toxin [Candidatus Peribacteria bacterium]